MVNSAFLPVSSTNLASTTESLDEAEVDQNFKSDTGLAVEPSDKLAVTWGTLKAPR